LDLHAHHELRRSWAGDGRPAWRLSPAAEDERRTHPISSSAPWTWTLIAGAGSVVVAHSYAKLYASPATRWATLMLYASSLLGVHVWRGSFGVVVARARFPKDALRTGRAGTIELTFDATRSELAPETFAFELQCVRARRAFAGVFPRRDVVVAVAPLRRELVNSDRLRSNWRLEFEPPAGAPGADLLASPAVYWRLCVEAAGPRAAYRETLLVPVFATPATGPPA
jgi:hypothetical protein